MALQKRFRVVGLMLLVLLALVAQGCGGSGSPDQKANTDHARLEKRLKRQLEKEDGAVIGVTPGQLYQDYKGNEVAADKKYKGQWVQLTGRLYSVTKDLSDDPVLVFSADQYGVAQVHAELFDVQFLAIDREQKTYTTQSALDAAAGLKKGQKLLVEGLGGGAVIGMPVLKECVIIPVD